MEILIVSKLISASSSSSEDSEDCSDFVEVEFQLPLKTWVIDPVEEDDWNSPWGKMTAIAFSPRWELHANQRDSWRFTHDQRIS